MSIHKHLLIILIGISSSSLCFSQSAAKPKKDIAVKVSKVNTELSQETVTADNLKDFPEIKTNAIEVKYSTSSYYFVRLKNDSLKRNR